MTFELSKISYTGKQTVIRVAGLKKTWIPACVWTSCSHILLAWGHWMNVSGYDLVRRWLAWSLPIGQVQAWEVDCSAGKSSD